VSSSSEESEEEFEDDEIESVESAIIEEDIPKGDATSRLAAVNLDWDNIRAVDIFAVLQSFIPTTSDQVIKKVTIYPSEFGKERLQKEAVLGPAIFDKTTTIEPTVSTAEAEDQVDTTLLRKYQLERLRYYYAIIECSSVSIANFLYKSLDGAELGSTANMLDLRFVPDEVTFDDTPKDEATVVPDGHEPSEFVTDALQHSKPKLTWDSEDPERKRLISEAFKRDAENGGWEALLGSDEEEEEEDMRHKYRNLLVDAVSEDEPEEREDGMEVTFPEQDNQHAAETSKNETTLEQYKRKERDRKHRKREEKIARKEPVETSTDLGFDDPFFTSANPAALKRKEKEAKRLAKKAAEDELAKKAGELDLLMHDQDRSGNHFNINDILKNQKKKKQKQKKRDAEKEMELQEKFSMDVNDPRFSGVYAGGEFAIDPNSAAFRKGLPGMEALLEEGRRRKRGTEGSASEGRKKKRK
jgi:hypothetical protein